MQLIRTESFRKIDPKKQDRWIAKQFNLGESEVKLADQRLLDAGLIKIVSLRYIRTHERVTTGDKTSTTVALRKLQRQIREKAIYSLDHDPIETRVMTSMTMAVDAKKLARARQLIEEFQECLSQELESGPKEKVYQLEVSLFPLQTIGNLK